MGDLLILSYGSQLFVWESVWKGFRPITSVAWNGVRHVVEDSNYRSDPTERLYGYGSREMVVLCEALTKKYSKQVAVRRPEYGEGAEWFRDRMVVFTPCAPRDGLSWKRLCNGRRKTCRQQPRGRHTTR